MSSENIGPVVNQIGLHQGSARRAGRWPAGDWGTSHFENHIVSLGIVTPYVTDPGIELTKAVSNPATDFPRVAGIGIIPPKGRHHDRRGTNRVGKKTGNRHPGFGVRGPSSVS
jgi:hypothetical protein